MKSEEIINEHIAAGLNLEDAKKATRVTLAVLLKELQSVEDNYDLSYAHPDSCLSETSIPYYREQLQKLM